VILSITDLVLRKLLLLGNCVLSLKFFTVCPSSVIGTQLLNVAKERDFEEARNRNELETGLLVCQFGFGISVLLQLWVTRAVFHLNTERFSDFPFGLTHLHIFLTALVIIYMYISGSSFDWFTGLFVLFVICVSDYFDFGFTTLN